ncbi:MAG: DUF1501 domain-containing protein, partial [Actinomycetota bacterium]|nr:DUF1501 domain-containing protein [Actinomycetota bacterium]
GDKAAATAITSPSIMLPGKGTLQSAFAALDGPGPDRRGLAAETGQSGADLLSVQRDLDQLLGHPAATASPGASGAAGQHPTASTSKGKGAAAAAAFGAQLQDVATLIKAGAPSRVYQVSLSSFDTHADEKTDQERLLAELDAGISAFFTTLNGSSHAEGVVLMTYSEFGRRVAENASGGTDHGTAAPLFVAGRAVKGKQFYGEQPSLTDLQSGDLKFNVDFRSVYATMLDRVIGVDPKPFLGAAFPTLNVV